MIDQSRNTSAPRDVAADARTLRSLHVAGAPLLLANAWDPPTASTIESAGAPVIGTGSAALAPANGWRDHGQMPGDVAFAALRRIVEAVTCPVTADLEDGYGLSPDRIAEELIDAGACGLNIEDGDHRAEGLVDAEAQARCISEIKDAARRKGVDVVLNARIDVHILRRPTGEGLARAKLYLEAGADCVYPIFLSDKSTLERYVALGPVNALYRPGALSLKDLSELGVSRISVGPLFSHLMLKRLKSAVGAFYRVDEAGLLA